MSTLEALRDLRRRLLPLHQQLLKLARQDYERVHERAVSPLELLKLVDEAPELAWLAPMNALVFQLDAAIDGPELEPGEAGALFAAVRDLLRPGERSDAFSVRYAQSLQDDPMLVLAHARVLQR